MRFELSRTFPTPRREGFEYLTDLATWSEWSPICIPDAEGAKFTKPKDVVSYSYRPLGIPIRGTMHLVDVEPGELLKLRFGQKAFSDVEMAWHFENAGAHAFTLTVTIDIEDTNWWDKTYQWISMMPTVIKRDMRHAMDALHTHFAHPEVEEKIEAAS